MTHVHDCWKCEHFMPENVLTSKSGRCTRKAPKGLDFNGLGAAPSELYFTAGIVNAFLISGPSLTSVFARSGDITAFHLVWFEDTAGMNANDMYPWIIPAGYQLTKIIFAASRVNVGAAAVGSNPVLNLDVAQVLGTTSPTITTVQVPIDPAHVGVMDNATDDFVVSEFNLSSPVSLSAGLWGFRINLQTGLDENIVVQVRNPQVGALCTKNENPALTSALSLAKYPLIPDGTMNRCGSFVPLTTGTVPAIPEV